MYVFLYCIYSLFWLSFSLENNLIFNAVRLSQTAYCENNVIDTWTCATCDEDATVLNIIENEGEKALVGVYSNTGRLFVSFRGSTNIQNWIDNVQFSLTCPYQNNVICVETGFYKVFEAMMPQVEKAVASAATRYNIDTILYTGHSLGGAVATLMAYYMSTNDNNDHTIELITFGSPRVGNAEFVEDFASSNIGVSYRITHAYDMVPHVPQMFLHYNHIPHEVWYNEDNSAYRECDDMYEEDPECSNSCAPIHCTSASDHLNYLNVTMGSDGCYESETASVFSILMYFNYGINLRTEALP
jgi:hypothetical protein